MKIYKKPQLVALSLSANGSLCAACTIDAEGANMAEEIKALYERFGDVVFTAETSCAYAVEGYCKFTAVDDGLPMIFNS